MWQRWNSTSHIFEKSSDDGVTWAALELDGSIISQGTVAAARIANLDTSKITTGTFADARLSANVAFLASANVFTLDQKVSKTRPQVQLLHSGTALSRFASWVANNAYLATNLGFDGANWNLDDITLAGISFTLGAAGLGLTFATAGANPRTPVGIFSVNTLGQIFEQSRSTALGSWTAYTPAWTASTTNPTLGNGTITGRSMVVGGTVFFYIEVNLGSTTNAGSGLWDFTLPSTPSASGAFLTGISLMRPAATDFRFGLVAKKGTGSVGIIESAGVNYMAASAHAWTTGDTVRLLGFYES